MYPLRGGRERMALSRFWSTREIALFFRMSVPSRGCSSVVEGLKYAKSHEWAKVVGEDGKLATVGITEHAQEHLGDVIYVELPDIGVAVTQGCTVGSVESVKASSDINSPIAGNIIEVNKELLSSPGLVNGSPYEKGWIMKVQMSNRDELNNLMDPDQYSEYVKTKIPNITQKT